MTTNQDRIEDEVRPLLRIASVRGRIGPLRSLGLGILDCRQRQSSHRVVRGWLVLM